MDKIGKGSAKKSKPSYFMAVLGVTIVLIIWGVLALMVIYANEYRKKKSEDLELNVYFKNSARKSEIDNMLKFIQMQPYTRSARFISKEEGKKTMLNDTTIDFSLLEENPLLDAVSFTLKSEYLNTDTIRNIKKSIESNTLIVNEVKYAQSIVDFVAQYFKNAVYILLGIALILSVLTGVLIDNTIKLSMYSNRFLIKTMQMVGATRWFIAKPMDIKAIINGLISGSIAVLFLWIIAIASEKLIDGLAVLRNNMALIWLSVGIIIVSIATTLFSTHRSVIKYLKMKLDDLY